MTLADRCARAPATVRRLIALLAVPLVLAIVAVLCLPIIHAKNVQDEWREQARRLLAQSKNADSVIAGLDERIADMRGSLLWSKFYPQESGAPLATLLQSDVGALLGSVQASPQSLAPLPAQEFPNFMRTGARVTVSMRVDQLRGWLAAIENHARYLRIERLAIVAPQAQGTTENPLLSVTAEIYGYQAIASATAGPASTTTPVLDIPPPTQTAAIQAQAVFHRSRSFYVAPTEPALLLPPPDYRFVGAIAVPGRPQAAMLIHAQTNSRRRVQAGDELDGWIVAKVDSQHVLLSLGDRTHEIAAARRPQVGGMTRVAPTETPAAPRGTARVLGNTTGN